MKKTLWFLPLLILTTMLYAACRSPYALALCLIVTAIWIISSIRERKRKGQQRQMNAAVMQPMLPLACEGKKTGKRPDAPTFVKDNSLPDKINGLGANADLAPSDFLNRVDAKSWYFNRNETILARIIDDLNVRSCKHLTIAADGSVHIEEDGTDQTILHLEEFPHHMNWPELCQLLSEDEITASITSAGIHLSWCGGV